MAEVTLKNTNPIGAIYLPLIGRDLAEGEEFTVDAAIAEALLEQVGNYEAVVAKSAESFENFWSAYPRRVSKGHARRAWVGAIKKSEPEAIVAAAAKYAATMKGTEQKFIPHPATWLNGERWADQAVTAAPPRSLPTEVEQPPTTKEK